MEPMIIAAMIISASCFVESSIIISVFSFWGFNALSSC